MGSLFGRPKDRVVKQVSFDTRAVAIALVKAANIHEGIWRVALTFERSAANVQWAIDPEKPPATVLSVLVAVTKFVLVRDPDLQEGEEPGPLSVDAAKVNPKVESVH